MTHHIVTPFKFNVKVCTRARENIERESNSKKTVITINGLQSTHCINISNRSNYKEEQLSPK